MAAATTFDVDAFVLAFVVETYARAEQYGLREPRIGVSAIVDHIQGTHLSGYTLTGTPIRRQQYRLVYNACQRLVKAGKLESSLGLSSSGGEERQFNPKKG